MDDYGYLLHEVRQFLIAIYISECCGTMAVLCFTIFESYELIANKV